MPVPFRLGPVLLLLSLAALSSAGGIQTPSRHSQITVRVFKSGFFSAFAHNHVISAPIAQARIDRETLSAAIVVAAKDMKVLDPEASGKDRDEIQTTMLGPKVLDADRFPEIRFVSGKIALTAPGQYSVSGTLQLHGTTKPIAFTVKEVGDHYQGTAKLKQTDFGIEPISIAGGTVKVKDEVEVEFDVYPGEFPNAGSR